jgi:hypothetical protein
MDPLGMDTIPVNDIMNWQTFDTENDVIELNSRISNKKGSGDLEKRINELKGTMADIEEMKNDKNTEYRYSNASAADNPAGAGNPQIAGLGTGIVTMYVENNLGSKIHESRHGGDFARGTLTLANYNVNHEVSAYKAQYSYDGIIRYQPVTTDNIIQMRMLEAFGPSIETSRHIGSFDAINANFVNTIGTSTYSNALGRYRMFPLYPPIGISQSQWNRKR